MQEGIRKNTIYNLIRTLSVIIFPLIRYPYLTRVLQPTNFGRISFATSILGYVTLFSMFGAEIYSVRELSKENKDTSDYLTKQNQIFTITVLTTIGTLITLTILVLLVGRMKQDALLIEIICMPVLLTTLGADWVNISRADLCFISLRTMFFQILATVLSLILVKTEKDIYIYAIVMGGTTVLTGLSNIIYRKRYGSLKLQLGTGTRHHFKSILYLFVLLFSQTIFLNLDITMIGFFRENSEVGEYSVACNIYNISSTVISAVSIVIIPRITKAIHEKKEEKIAGLQKFSMEYILTIGIPIVIGINLLTNQIITLLSGDEYLGAIIPLHILSIALIVVMFGGAFLGNIVLLPAEKERIFTFASLIAAGTNTVLNAFLIPIFGCIAASVTTVISESIILIILLVCGHKYVRVKPRFRWFIQPVVASLVFIPIRFLFNRFLPDTIYMMIDEICIDIVLYYLILRIMNNGFIKDFFRGEEVTS